MVHLTNEYECNHATRLTDWEIMYIIDAIVRKLPNPIFSIPDWRWLRSVGGPSRKSSEGCRVWDFPPRLRLSSNVERLVRIPPGRDSIMLSTSDIHTISKSKVWVQLTSLGKNLDHTYLHFCSCKNLWILTTFHFLAKFCLILNLPVNKIIPARVSFVKSYKIPRNTHKYQKMGWFIREQINKNMEIFLM